MTIARTNPAGWGVNDKLTSAQANGIDISTSHALDKTTAGDTLSGLITMASTSAITCSAAGAIINIGTPGGFLAAVTGAVQANASGSIASTVVGGIQAGVAFGIESGVADGIASMTTYGIVSNAVSGIGTVVAGGFQLAGGANDWPTFSATRSRNILQSAMVNPVGSSNFATAGTHNVYASTGAGTIIVATTLGAVLFSTGNTSSSAASSYFQMINTLHNGATLSTVTLSFMPYVGHTSMPAVMPAFGVYRVKNGTVVSLLSTGAVQYPTPSFSTYINGAVKTLVLTTDQNNVIDTSQYAYFVEVWDEASTNALAGNAYYSILLGYTAIPNMAFA